MAFKKILTFIMWLLFLLAAWALCWSIWLVLSHKGHPGLGGFFAGMLFPWVTYRMLSWGALAFTNLKVKLKWGVFPYL